MDAAVIDAAAAERIRAFEAARTKGGGFRWPVVLALALGGLMVGAGVLLFVSAHWDEMSPGGRMALIVALVLVFHIAGAVFRNRFESMSVAMHALGTIALGGGIALTGQVFHLDTEWPWGALLWSAGAAAGWALLRHWPQAALAAILVPNWLIAQYESMARAQTHTRASTAIAAGCAMLAFTYLSARIGEQRDPIRRALVWIGALALIPSVIIASIKEIYWFTLEGIALGVAAALSLALAFALRREAAVYNLGAVIWTVGLAMMHAFDETILRYIWLAIGSMGLAFWGIRERRIERINLGVVGFAITVLSFYFANVMDRIGRSASLVVLGILFLAGGYGLERVRRRLVAQIKEEPR